MRTVYQELELFCSSSFALTQGLLQAFIEYRRFLVYYTLKLVQEQAERDITQ